MDLFRRRIDIVSNGTPEHGETRSVLEDDFHHFRVAVAYRDGIVSNVSGSALRNPYSVCPAAGAELVSLHGMALNPVANSVTRQTNARLQCTHMLDLAGLAVAAAARHIARRTYEVEVPRRNGDATSGLLLRDGVRLLEWQITGETIMAPPAFAGIHLKEGLARWALNNLSEDQAEAALILRRCLIISRGRERNLDLVATASPTGNCFAQQPQRAQLAIRIVGSTLDLRHRHAQLAQDDQRWLDCLPDQG